MIIIKSVTGGLRFSTPINEGATRKRALMGDDLITLPFSVSRPIAFKIGDYADIEGFGRFVITDTPQPTYNETTGGYDYELKMEAQYRKWKNKLLKFLPQVGASETSWVLTASITVHAEQVMANINALCESSESYLYNGSTQWQISFDGMSDEELTTAQVVSYDSISILDGLSAIAEAFGVEYWVEDNTIHFGRCEYGDTHIPLEIGVNVESMSRNNTGEPFATRLYVFGSEKNLPATYRKDLIFTIDKVNGQLITDVARPLRAEWFNKDNYIYSDGSYQDYHVGFSLAQDVYKDPSYYDDSVLLTTGNWEGVTHRLDAVGTFDVGEYNVSMGGFKPRVIVTPTNETNDWRGIESIKGEVIVYSGDTEIARTSPSAVYIQSIGTEYTLTFSDFDFTIEGASKQYISIVINLYAVFQHIGEAHIAVDAFADNIINIRHRRLIPGVKDITLKVVSGEKEGTIIEGCVFNPYFAKEGTTARPILLPDGVTLQEGDRFEIQNIKLALVPNAYYSASATLDNNSEIVQNGIVSNRLMLPEGTPYIDAYDGLTAEEAVEDVVIFEEIYPQVESEITEVSVDYVSSEDGTDEKEYPQYKFKTNTKFSTEYYIEGETLSITIESGVLNGWTFEVAYSEAREEFTIVRDAENNVPNEILCPVVGDKFKFFNFNAAMMSEVAVPEAENRLLEAGKTYLAEAMKDPSNYDCVMMSDAMSGYDGEVIRPENALVLGLGRRVRLINLAYGSRDSRVIGYEMPLDFPWDSPKYTIGEKATYSRLGAIEDKLDAIEVSMGGKTYFTTSTGGDSIVNVGSSVYLIKAQDGTPPSESNAYSAIRSRREFTLRNFAETIPYQWRFSKGIAIGNFVSTSSGAAFDYAGNAEVNSLVSRGAINAPLVIADKESDGTVLSSNDFDGTSALTGTGYGISKEGNIYRMAIDYLTVRKGMSVAVLVIQEYKSLGGVLVVSACNGEIEKVHKWSNGGGYDVYIKDFEENPQFVAGDLVRCAKWDSETNSYVGYWVKVVAVPTNADGYKCLNLMASQFPEGVEPQVGDQLVQFGNTEDTSRQGLIIISVENGHPNVTAYDGIDAIDVNLLDKMCARLGDLNGIVKDDKTLTGYGLWTNNLYLSSATTTQTFEEITASISSQFEAVDGLFTSVQKEITSIKDNQSGMATQLSEAETAIAQNANQINLRATKTELGEAEKSLQASININAEAITSEVSAREEGDKELISQIEQTAESISLKLSEKALSNVNHAIGTENAKEKNTGFDESNANLTQALYNVTGFKTGDKITISFDWEWEGLSWPQASSEVTVQFSDVYGYKGVGFKLVDGDAKSGHYVSTLTLGQTYSADPVANPPRNIVEDDVAFIYVRFSLIAQSSEDGYFKISNLKVELGEEETAWTSRTGDLEAAMEATGIDINKRQIIATADNFTIRNNEGDVTASVNKEGEFSSNSVLCRNTDDDTKEFTPFLTTLNRDGNGYLEFYYPLTKDNGNNNIAFQIGWDQESESIFRFYKKDGSLAWFAGNEANLIDSVGGKVTITTIEQHKCDDNIILASNEIKTTASLSTTKIYKRAEQSAIDGVVTYSYYSDAQCNVPLSGNYADKDAMYNFATDEFGNAYKYVRRLYTYTNGSLTSTRQIRFNE